MVSSNYSNSKNNSIIIYNNIGVISLYSKLNMLTFQVYDKAYYKVYVHIPSIPLNTLRCFLLTLGLHIDFNACAYSLV